MSPPKQSGGPGHHPEAAATSKIPAATIKPDDRGQATASPQAAVAFGTRYIAAGDASLDWVVVRRCPLCGHAHRHLMFEKNSPSNIERAPSCARHRVYIVRITDVVPTSAERQQRGAA